MVLFGHQTGNPNSHHAALAHFERGRLAAFVVPWFPGETALGLLKGFPPTRSMAMRLSRRRFEPLAAARLVQGRPGEFRRLLRRATGFSDEKVCYEVNDWLMEKMSREVGRREVTAVHSPEDASLRQFQEAKRLGKACVYDMPTCYYPWWQEREQELLSEYARWVPEGGIAAHRWVRPSQKMEEMKLADLVLAPSSFVRRTILERCDKRVEVCVYGAEASTESGAHPPAEESTEKVRFLHVGQCSIRKGTPFLLELWRRLAPKDAELTIAGTWNLANSRLKDLPPDVSFVGSLDPMRLRALYAKSHVLLFPSFSDGFGLVMLEALAAGMAVIGSSTSGAPDLASNGSVTVADAGHEDAWVAAIRNRIQTVKSVGHMRALHAECARANTWAKYRTAVGEATADLV